MGLKRKQILEQQKAFFEKKLADRLAFLAEKGILSPKAEKDTVARKWKAHVKAAKKRLAVIADNKKKEEDIAKAKAEKAAGVPKEQDGGKAEKPKKAPEEGQGKKAKGEAKAAHPKAAEGGKGHKKAESKDQGPAS